MPLMPSSTYSPATGSSCEIDIAAKEVELILDRGPLGLILRADPRIDGDRLIRRSGRAEDSASLCLCHCLLPHGSTPRIDVRRPASALHARAPLGTAAPAGRC